MLDVAGTDLCAEDIRLLENPLVGGLILFSRNYSGPDQLTRLVTHIRAVNPGILIAVDHEGGRVQRFRSGFTRLPPMAKLGALYKTDPDQALILANDCGWILAAELRSVDVDFSFAPVLDVDFGVSTVIGDRSFSADPAVVSRLATALTRGMRDAGMAATGKHFPGHGFVRADSHLEIPQDPRAYETLVEQDMQPFGELIGQGLDAIMPAHVIYTQVDAQPAGFSSRWLQQVLRDTLGFRGVVFSDDLTMEGAAVAGGYAQRAAAALRAGCDMLLVCNHRPGALEVLDYLSTLEGPDIFKEKGERLTRMRGGARFQSLAALQETTHWQESRKRLQAL